MASWWLKTSYISEATGPIARLCAETCSRLVDMATGPGATGRSSLVQVIMAAEAWRDGAQVLRGYLKSFEINRQETIWNRVKQYIIECLDYACRRAPLMPSVATSTSDVTTRREIPAQHDNVLSMAYLNKVPGLILN